mgnify:CR=1 FL=1
MLLEAVAVTLHGVCVLWRWDVRSCLLVGVDELGTDCCGGGGGSAHTPTYVSPFPRFGQLSVW